MPTIAPWLQPTNTLASISAGAQAGLQQRAHTDAAAEASARLKQSYDSMAQQADQERANALARVQAQQTAQALQAQQNDAMNRYRQQQMQVQQAEKAASLGLATQREARESKASDALAAYHQGILEKQAGQAGQAKTPEEIRAIEQQRMEDQAFSSGMTRIFAGNYTAAEAEKRIEMLKKHLPGAAKRFNPQSDEEDVSPTTAAAAPPPTAAAALTAPMQNQGFEASEYPLSAALSTTPLVNPQVPYGEVGFNPPITSKKRMRYDPATGTLTPQ